jgi:glutaredoxin 3
VNFFANFDRYVIGERNEGLRRKMRTLRLRRRLRKNGEEQPGLRLASFVSKSTLPLLRRAGLAG